MATDPTPDRPDRAPVRRPRRYLLLAVPYLWSVLAAAGVGTVHVLPGGVPLLLWWMLAGVLVTSGTLALVWRIDNRHAARGGKEPGR